MHKYVFLIILMFLLSCSESSNETISKDSPAVPTNPVVSGVSLELAQYRKETISNINYELSFSIPEEQNNAINAKEILTFELSDRTQDLQLDFKESADKIKAISVNSQQQKNNLLNEHLVIDKRLLNQGLNEIEIEFVAGDNSLNRNPDYLYALFVPDRARTAFPVFDQPNLKATYDLTLELPADWESMANAPLQDETIVGKRVLRKYEKSDLVSTYLFSFVAGKFQSITREIGGHEITMLHRENDEDKVQRNVDAIFQLHYEAIIWLENYTLIKYPFKKFGFVLIPSFQFGGMEHVGSIQYRDSTLLLDESPSQARLMARAALIAHETSHMWFGDLVTMDWFNDVWTKEVFAGFMSNKIVHPLFPEINHDLGFLTRTYSRAYGVERTEGANPIRQKLPNLNEAGTLYGSIIYAKAPIMMKQLETMLGQDKFQEGMQEYLHTYANKNATWPNLIDILDKKSEHNLEDWSEVWVNTAGRPEFSIEQTESGLQISQNDPDQLGRYWPQTFGFTDLSQVSETTDLVFNKPFANLNDQIKKRDLFINSDGRGYGLFPVSKNDLTNNWGILNEQQRGVHFVYLYELLLDNKADLSPQEYIDLIIWTLEREDNQLIINMIIRHLENVYWSLLTPELRTNIAAKVEIALWQAMNEKAKTPGQKRTLFRIYKSIVLTEDGIDRVSNIWSGSLKPEGLKLSEIELIDLAAIIAIKRPPQAEAIVEKQSANIKNPDRKRRFDFIKPILSADVSVRDNFFTSLMEEKNRQVESWVLAALNYLHHPLRLTESEKYILPSLELLNDIQVTGDIFFPERWTNANLRNYQSDTAVATVREFLEKRPNYNYQLKLKILQSADMMFRANRILYH